MTARSPFWSIRLRRPSLAPGLVAFLGAAVPVAAAKVPDGVATPAAPEVVHFSTTQRFAARGTDPLQTVPFLTWLEEAAGRLERALGGTLPAERGRPILFVLAADPDTTNAVIRREILTGSRGLGQVVRITNPERAEPADVLAAAVSMMVARYVSARQSPADREARPALAPDWFACGLAGTLYAVPRLALQHRALETWTRAADPPIETLLGPGPAAAPFAPMAEWTALVAWLRLRPGFQDLAGRLMDAWAAGRMTDAGSLATCVDSGWSARDLAQQWDLAVAAALRTEAPWRLTPADLASRLRDALRIPRDRIPIVLPDDISGPVDIRTLLARRGEPWSRALAQAMLMAVDQVPSGRDASLTRAANAYRGVLYGLMQPVPSGSAGWIPRRIGAWRLRRSLDSADRQFDDLEAVIAARPEAPESPVPGRAPGDASSDARIEAEAMRQIFHDGFRTPP